MEDFKQITCRLCQYPVEHTNYDFIDNVAKNIVTVVFPNLQISKEEQPIMCHMCATKLLAAFEFKTLCLETERTVESYVKIGKVVLPLDLITSYQKERNEQVNCSTDQNVCRLCMQLAQRKCTPLGDTIAQLVQMYIAEVNLAITKDPVVCDSCLDSLVTHTGFIKSCLGMEKKIKIESENCIEENARISSGPQCKQESVKIECKDEITPPPEFYEEQIKQESIDLKFEEESPQESAPSEETTLKTEWCGDGNTPNETKNEETCQQFKMERKTTPDSYEEAVHSNNIQSQRHTDPSITTKTYKCEECPFETKYKSNLKCHKLQHVDPSTIEMIACDECSYRTPYKYRLEKHKLIHADVIIIETFKCSECPFETRRKECLKTHKLKHADPSQVEIIKCEHCPYQTKRKSALRHHRIIHADTSRIKKRQCDKCPYQAIRKKNLDRHKLTHVDSSEMKPFQCDICPYRSFHKWNLAKHKLKHADVSEVDMFKCDRCPYQTKYRFTLIRHKLIHDDPSQIVRNRDRLKLKCVDPSQPKAYACDVCSFRGSCMSKLDLHKLKHASPSEIEMFKCDLCAYETKYKCSLTRHKLKHADPSEIVMFKCDSCPYQTMYKSSLNKHKLMHADISEINMFKCNRCSYQAKYKCNFDKHLLKHADTSQAAETTQI